MNTPISPTGRVPSAGPNIQHNVSRTREGDEIRRSFETALGRAVCGPTFAYVKARRLIPFLREAALPPGNKP